MGCDIHLHVEMRKAGSEQQFIHSYFKGEFRKRNYEMFAKLANVRNYCNVDHLPIRGLPDNISYNVFDEIYRKIISECIDDFDKEYCYSQKNADRWISRGYSFKIEIKGSVFCSNPDWHSYNWCTPDELLECIDDVFKDKTTGKYTGDYYEWVALAAYMKALEDNGNFEVRAVYWFDN
jgi:hypothetical protein